MKPRISVLFHGMPRSEAVELAIARSVERLDHTYGRIQHCSVRVDRPHLHDHTSHFQVRLAIEIPGQELAISHNATDRDVYVAVSYAFTAARRRLRDRVQIRRGEVKAHSH